ncbi:SHOCT domain-containing protein [Dactylosporangium sp. CA-092794]|uniref:SHOCT domain-containing protein n=1 Tax=Dactylosporangium sp. CA-092794 TaxID=3239929 RepID=UPI003D909A7F
MMWYHNGLAMFPAGLLILLTLAASAAALVVLAVRRTGPVPPAPPPPHRPTNGAEQLLAERYARGEIDEAEYHHRLEVLRGAKTG